MRLRSGGLGSRVVVLLIGDNVGEVSQILGGELVRGYVLDDECEVGVFLLVGWLGWRWMRRKEEGEVRVRVPY